MPWLLDWFQLCRCFVCFVLLPLILPLLPILLCSAPLWACCLLSGWEKDDKRRREAVLSSICPLQGLWILQLVMFLGGWGSVPAPFIVFQSFLCIACNPLPICQAPFNTKGRRWGKGVRRKNIPINSPLEQNCFPNTQLLWSLDAP